MLLREADRRLGLTRSLDAALPDPRDPDLITHAQVDLLRQRIYGLALGYEDRSPERSRRITIRCATIWPPQSAVERDTGAGQQPDLVPARRPRPPPQWLAHPPPALFPSASSAVAMHAVLLEKFIASFAAPPAELVLDFDATDDRIHGGQEGRLLPAPSGAALRAKALPFGCLAPLGSTATTATGASCRFTFFAASSSWSATCVRATSMRRGTPRRSSSCW